MKLFGTRWVSLAMTKNKSAQGSNGNVSQLYLCSREETFARLLEGVRDCAIYMIDVNGWLSL